MRRHNALGVIGGGIFLLVVVGVGCGPDPFKLLQDQIDEITTQVTDLQSNQAAQGQPGVPGLQGDTGATGAQGPAGADGAAGAAGRNGTNGQNGAPGTNGTSGTDGTNGTNGANGTRGVDGAAGRSCWDLNGDGVADPNTEDRNGDCAVDEKDCEWSGLLARAHVDNDPNGGQSPHDANETYLEYFPPDPNVPGKYSLVVHFAPCYRFGASWDVRSFPIVVTPQSFTAIPGQPPTNPISAMVEPVELNEAARTLTFNVYEIQWAPPGPAPINMEFYVIVLEP